MIENKVTKSSSDLLIPLVCGTVLVLLLFIVLDATIADKGNQLYSNLSIMLMFASVLVIFMLSFEQSVTAQWASLMWTIYFTHRFIITYFLPETLDYHANLDFTTEQIEEVLFYFFLSVLGFAIGVLLSKNLYTKPIKRYAINELRDNIVVFGIEVSFENLVRILLYVVCALYIFKIYAMISLGLGVTGHMYSADVAFIVRFVQLANALAFPVIFLLVYVQRQSSLNRLVKITFFLFLVSGILIASRALILSIIFGLYLSSRILGVQIERKYYVWSFVALFLAVFVFYPLITSFRIALVLGDIGYLSLSADYLNLVLKVSGRVGNGYESLFLWYTQASSQLLSSNQFSIFTDAAVLINTFFPGDLIPMPTMVDLSKLQVVIGRGGNIDILAELGGHAENPGPWGMLYLYFGDYAPIYWGTIYFVLTKIEKLDIHPFWKYFFISSYAVGPSNVVLMSTAGFSFLVCVLVLVILIRLYIEFFYALHKARTLG